MKMIMISYNQAIEEEVTDILARCGMENYTKWTQVQGKGKTSGTHLGNEVWPGLNNVLFCAVEESKVKSCLDCVEELRNRLGKEGVKAFVWDLEATT